MIDFFAPDGYDITIISYDISSMQKRGKLWI